MSFISEEKINEVRDRANIVTVISQYVNLKKMGFNYKGLCPFHPEKTPSFVVSETKKIYHCFGCAKGGNVFGFLMEHARLSFPEAVQKLAAEYGIFLPVEKESQAKKGIKSRKELLYKLNKNALLFFQSELKKDKRAQEFLKKRGISLAVCSQYYVGYAPADWQSLFDFFKKKGVLTQDVLELGLVVQKEATQRYYDRFRDRIIFPLFDLSRRVLGFGGRSLEDQAMPKYLNSSESLIYNKRIELYGLSHGLRDIGREGVILVEGYFDCLMMHQAGFKQAVATMGTALSENHVSELKHYTDQFYVFFDNDEAGRQASERSLSIFLPAGISPKVIELGVTKAKDPDDYIRLVGKEALAQKIKQARPLIEFVMDRILDRCENLSSRKVKVIEAMAPYLSQIINPLEKEEAVKKLADRLQVEEKWILKPLQELGSKSQTPLNLKNLGNEIQSQYIRVELEVIEFLVLFPHWLEKIAQEKVLDLLTDLEVKTILLRMIEHYQSKQTIDFSTILEKIESLTIRDRLAGGVLQKENQGRSEAEWKVVYEDSLKRLHKNDLERMEKQLLSQIRELNGQEDRDLLVRYQDVVKQKQQYL